MDHHLPHWFGRRGPQQDPKTKAHVTAARITIQAVNLGFRQPDECEAALADLTRFGDRTALHAARFGVASV